MGDWVKREADFRLSHPEVFERSWESILVDDDHDGLARLLGDMLKVKPNGVRVGKRPVLSRVDAEQRLAAISGDDFSDDPFLPTFRRLCEGVLCRMLRLGRVCLGLMFRSCWLGLMSLRWFLWSVLLRGLSVLLLSFWSIGFLL